MKLMPTKNLRLLKPDYNNYKENYIKNLKFKKHIYEITMNIYLSYQPTYTVMIMRIKGWGGLGNAETCTAGDELIFTYIGFI